MPSQATVCCSRCGQRVGVYEPLWAELPDGTMKATCYLDVIFASHPSDRPVAVFHELCYAA